MQSPEPDLEEGQNGTYAGDNFKMKVTFEKTYLTKRLSSIGL